MAWVTTGDARGDDTAGRQAGVMKNEGSTAEIRWKKEATMSTLHRSGRVIQAGSGLALLAAIAVVGGRASGETAGVSSQPGDPSIGEIADSLASSAREIVYTCTLAGGTLMGSLRFFSASPPEHPTCAITAPELPGASRAFCKTGPGGPVCPDCESLQRSLQCFAVP
jgi:hypothetical protein